MHMQNFFLDGRTFPRFTSQQERKMTGRLTGMKRHIQDARHVLERTITRTFLNDKIRNINDAAIGIHDPHGRITPELVSM
jgi:hypothetical protein